MKRILLSFVLVIAFALQTNAADYYQLGVNAYKAGKMDDALYNFELAIKINPKDVNARYYLAQTYILDKMPEDAEKQYNKIILLAPDSQAAMLSQKGLSLLRQAELGVKLAQSSGKSSQYGENYLQYVLTEGKIRKWQTFPISVYIEPKKSRSVAQKAFEEWQSETKSLVKFNFTTNRNAQITVSFKDKLEASAGNQSYVAGYSKPYYKNGFLNKSDITILTIDPATGKELPDEFILFSTLHEIGHSLGFNGHSPEEEDVMASSSSEPKSKLTKRDINTIRLFYTLDEKALAAQNSGQTDVKLQQLLDYVKKFPNKAVSWANLGDHYRSKQMYTEAIQNYKKAISIEPSNGELYNLIGVTYSKMGDSNAYKNLKRACDLDKSNDFYLYQFVKSCTKPEEKTVGQKYLKDFISANPDKANDEKIKSLTK